MAWAGLAVGRARLAMRCTGNVLGWPCAVLANVRNGHGLDRAMGCSGHGSGRLWSWSDLACDRLAMVWVTFGLGRSWARAACAGPATGSSGNGMGFSRSGPDMGCVCHVPGWPCVGLTMGWADCELTMGSAPIRLGWLWAGQVMSWSVLRLHYAVHGLCWACHELGWTGSGLGMGFTQLAKGSAGLSMF
jgi:hypothetical protein